MPDAKSKRPKMSDVAKRAGVGTATVDRVLNERGNVSEDIRKKVLQAARELGLRRILPSSHHRLVRVNVVLARTERPLVMRIAAEFRKQAQRLDRTLSIHRTLLKDESAEAISAAMLRGNFDAIVVDPPDHPLLVETIAKLQAQGKPVINVISDVEGSNRLAYAGTNNYKAGRSAGYFMSHMLPSKRASNKVVVLCHNEGFQCHSERIRGLQDQFATSELTVAQIVRGGDDPQLSEVLLKEAFRRHPDTVGVYNAGGANRGVIAAIKADILHQRPTFIGHELTPFTYNCLRDGLMTLTIDQSPELQVQYALEVLMNHFGFDGATHAVPPYVSDVPVVLYGPQNLPDNAPVGEVL